MVDSRLLDWAKTVGTIREITGGDDGYHLLNRDEIREYAEAGMIEPFVNYKVQSPPGLFDNLVNMSNLDIQEATNQQIISYGLEHYGYGIRIANQFEVFAPDPKKFNKYQYINPKRFDPELLQHVEGDCFIPPNSYALGYSVEKFDIPDDIMCVVLGKSTYARCGLIVNVTPGEPGWNGHWTIELSNATPLPSLVYANEGIAQVLFFRGPKPSTNYASTNGKYMNQPNKVVLAKV